MDFSDFLVRRCPPTTMYIPNFITFEEEQHILSRIGRAPKPKWTQLINRRLINYGGIPHPNGMVAEEIPEWLQKYVDKINNLSIFDTQKGNHVLVNEYLRGQGIMPHTDGPLFYPIITTISCGSHTVLEFSKRQSFSDNDTAVGVMNRGSRVMREVLFKLILEPRSLLILKDSLYNDYMHSISEIDQDILCDRISNYDECGSSYKMGECLKRCTRISLTIRNVPNTTKMKLKFL